MISEYLEHSRKRWMRILLFLALGLTILFFVNLSFGSVHIPLASLLGYLTDSTTGKGSWDLILANYRLPKAFTAMLAGGALGLSGLQMQTLFRNPLAGPYILGISSGAGLGVAIAIFLSIYLGGIMEISGLARSWMMVSSAGAGALLVLFIISVAAHRVRDNVSLLIIGLMFGTASSAIISILQYFSQAENIQAYVFWSFGSLSNLSWTELGVFAPLILVGIIGSFLLSKRLNGLLLGESYALSLGINLKTTRFLLILNTAILAGTVTAFCGPIAFLGIALPHIGRMLFSTSNHYLLTPIIVLLGSALMLMFDLIAQLPAMEATLPINAVTALFGAPFVIYLLLRKKSLNYSYRS